MRSHIGGRSTTTEYIPYTENEMRWISAVWLTSNYQLKNNSMSIFDDDGGGGGGGGEEAHARIRSGISFSIKLASYWIDGEQLPIGFICHVIHSTKSLARFSNKKICSAVCVRVGTASPRLPILSIENTMRCICHLGRGDTFIILLQYLP